MNVIKVTYEQYILKKCILNPVFCKILLKPFSRKLHCFFAAHKNILAPHQRTKFPHRLLSLKKSYIPLQKNKLFTCFILKIEAVLINKTFDMTLETARFHQHENIFNAVKPREISYTLLTVLTCICYYAYARHILTVLALFYPVIHVIFQKTRHYTGQSPYKYQTSPSYTKVTP